MRYEPEQETILSISLSRGMICWLENKSQGTEVRERRPGGCVLPAGAGGPSLQQTKPQAGRAGGSQGCESWLAEEAESQQLSFESPALTYGLEQCEGRCKVPVGSAMGVGAGAAPLGLLAGSWGSSGVQL